MTDSLAPLVTNKMAFLQSKKNPEVISITERKYEGVLLVF